MHWTLHWEDTQTSSVQEIILLIPFQIILASIFYPLPDHYFCKESLPNQNQDKGGIAEPANLRSRPVRSKSHHTWTSCIFIRWLLPAPAPPLRILSAQLVHSSLSELLQSLRFLFGSADLVPHLLLQVYLLHLHWTMPSWAICSLCKETTQNKSQNTTVTSYQRFIFAWPQCKSKENVASRVKNNNFRIKQKSNGVFSSGLNEIQW